MSVLFSCYLVRWPGPVQGEVGDQGVSVQPPGIDHDPSPQHVLIQHQLGGWG